MPFVKGQSGNPGGRIKGFGWLIRKRTKNGRELVDLALSVLRGELSVVAGVDSNGRPYEVAPAIKERMDALKWLAERGFGKVPQVVIDLSTADDDELRAEVERRANAQRGGLEQPPQNH
jgi:hypothetical protein